MSRLAARCFVYALCFVPTANAADLRQVGTLGNSGESGQTLVLFEGKPAPGIGPVLDDRSTLWERGGSRRLCRYSLDGRLLASLEIPESERPSDQLTLVGDTLVLKIGSRLFTLSTDAEPGADAAPLEGEAETLSADAFDGRVVLFDRGPGELFWLDPKTGTREPIVKQGFDVQALGTGLSGIVQLLQWNDDVPGQIMLFSRLWGEIRFATSGDRSRTNAEVRP